MEISLQKGIERHSNVEVVMKKKLTYWVAVTSLYWWGGYPFETRSENGQRNGAGLITGVNRGIRKL
mgnify:CR=1 FL=1